MKFIPVHLTGKILIRHLHIVLHDLCSFFPPNTIVEFLKETSIRFGATKQGALRSIMKNVIMLVDSAENRLLCDVNSQPDGFRLTGPLEH